MPPLHNVARKLQQHQFTEEGGSEYSATTFGGFGEYFANKQVKLQNQAQEAALHEEEGTGSTIFKDCVVYVTGFTDPPAQELKRLVTLHGGVMCNYLGGKTYATHIIATNLTARKRIEFEKYKVVLPSWVTDSVEAGKRLAWSKYRAIDSGEDRSREIRCLDPGFIKRYYEQSRLHHLSQWKADLKRKFQLKAQRSNSRNTSFRSQSKHRVIMHVDYDSFFVAVSLLSRPELKHQPVCVSNSKTDAGTGDVASCNYVARQYGVKNGMWLTHAKKLCPELHAISYDFAGYERASEALYESLLGIKPDYLYPVSVDEALLDITSCCDGGYDSVMKLAEDLRATIRQKSLVEASIGIGSNVLLAKLSLKRAKPRGSYYIQEQNKLDQLESVEIDQLPGVGSSIRNKLNRTGVYTVGELRNLEISQLQKLVGGTKIAARLFEYARGVDKTTDITVIQPPKSVSVEIAWGVRVNDNEQLKQFTTNLCAELCERMANQNLRGAQMVAKIYQRHKDAPIQPPKFMGCGVCDIYSKSSQPFSSTRDFDKLVARALELVLGFKCPPKDVRGVGLQMAKLDGSEDPTTPQKRTLAEFAVHEPNHNSNKQPKKHEIPALKRSPVKVGHAPKYMTLTRMAKAPPPRDDSSRQRRSATPTPAPAPEYDLHTPPEDVHKSVWEALPDEVKVDIIKYNRNRLQPLQTRYNQQRRRPMVETQLRPYTAVRFLDTADFATIRKYITNWICQSDEGEPPHYDDVCAVDRYLCTVAQTDADWGKAVTVLKLMRRTIQQQKPGDKEWQFLIDNLENDTSQYLLNRGIRVQLV